MNLLQARDEVTGVVPRTIIIRQTCTNLIILKLQYEIHLTNNNKYNYNLRA